MQGTYRQLQRPFSNGEAQLTCMADLHATRQVPSPVITGTNGVVLLVVVVVERMFINVT